jgi:hypothetical protein
MDKVLHDNDVTFKSQRTSVGLSWLGHMPNSKIVWEVSHPAAGWKKWAQKMGCYLMVAWCSQIQNETVDSAQNAHT